MNTEDKARLNDLLDSFGEAHQELADVQHEVGTARYTSKVQHASNVRDLVVEVVESLIATDPRGGLRPCTVGMIDDGRYHGHHVSADIGLEVIVEDSSGELHAMSASSFRFTDVGGDKCSG